jgi:peptidoglycan/xylan/chitin deacetylase (PgdA/CDA1 family)
MSAGLVAKRAVAQVLYALGLLQAWQAVALRQRAVVLMYHRVLTPEQRAAAGSHPAMVVSRDAFEMQMAVLRRRFVPLSVDAFWERLASRQPFPDSSCLITFDDGWRDNVENALPALRRHGLPALIFLPVHFIGSTRVFWQEALAHLLRGAAKAHGAEPARRAAIEARLGSAGLERLLAAGALDDPLTLFKAIDGLKTRTRPEILALVEGLAGDLGVPLETLSRTDGFMTWEQAEELARDGVAWGGHGVEHHLLTLVPPEVVREEAEGSRAEVARRAGQPPLAFSYPNGYVNDAVVRTVKAAGYQLGFITRRGHVRCDDDPFLIRRLNIHEAMTDTPSMFLARLVGLW